MRRVLHLLDRGGYGGIARIATEIAIEGPSIGSSSVLVVGEEPLVDYPSFADSRLATSGSTFALIRASLAVRSWVARTDPDLVHVHHRGIALAAKMARLDVPILEHVHSTYCDRKLTSFRGSDHLVAVGSTIVEQLTSIYGRPPTRVTLVHNGVRDKGVLPWNSGPLRLLVVGRAERDKGADIIAAAAEPLRSAFPNISIEWLGNGPMLDQLGASGVEVPGARPDIWPSLRRAHLVVLLSRREGLPLSILEALCSGRPVLATNVGAMADAVVSGWNGLLLENLSVTSFVESVKDVSEHDLEVWGRNGRTLYESRFTLDRMVSKTAEVYRLLDSDR